MRIRTALSIFLDPDHNPAHWWLLGMDNPWWWPYARWVRVRLGLDRAERIAHWIR